MSSPTSSTASSGPDLGRQRERAEKEQRKRVVRESRKRAEREQNACLGKWFTEKVFVNHFPKFSYGFSGQQQKFSY
jgi:hypothetical protein